MSLKASFQGPTIHAPNLFNPVVPATGNYQAEVANVPFTMTGTVEVYSGDLQSPVTLALPISGLGVYFANGVGNFLAGGIPNGLANFQFLPDAFSLGLDAAAQGSWNGKYGLDGYLIANGPAKLRPYASASVAGGLDVHVGQGDVGRTPAPRRAALARRAASRRPTTRIISTSISTSLTEIPAWWRSISWIGTPMRAPRP